MRVAILGAGFTGLTAGLRLLQKGHDVTLFEKEESAGGLAAGFREKGWEWSAERAYHHWFTNDTVALSLARGLDWKVFVRRPSTDVYVQGKRLPLDSPFALIAFPYIPLVDRLRTGMAALFLKFVDDPSRFEGKRALSWIKKWMGEKSLKTIWEPLFSGKFGEHKDDIALTWFWARIKKRTPSLAYPQGGFGMFAEQIANEIRRLGGKIFLGTQVTGVKMVNGKWQVANSNFDKIIVTLPTPIFVKLVKGLPSDYVARISSINYLHALNLILILDKPFMEKTYWLNITDTSFPFLVIVEHTNFMDPKHYGGKHIVYIGNYLPREHRYFKMTKEQLLKEFYPFLKKINPLYPSSLITYHSFVGHFAQPIVTVNYPKHLPTMETPIPNVYLANLSMVYPWDRGTNYAIELGEKVANLVISY